MKIEIVNLQTVKADDVIFGNFAEACTRLPANTAILQAALEDYCRGGEDARALAEDRAQTIAAAKAAYLAGDTETIARLIADTEKTAKQKQAEVLAAEIADKQAQLAELQKD